MLCGPVRAQSQGAIANFDRVGWRDSLYRNRERAALISKERALIQRQLEFSDLQAAKMGLLNGQIERARVHLERSDQHAGQFEVVKLYYQGIIAFIENRFADSLKLIAHRRFDSFDRYPRVCILRLVNLLALGDFSRFEREKASCTLSTGPYAYRDHLWPETLADLFHLRAGRRELVRDWSQAIGHAEDTDLKSIHLWLKSMLFLNWPTFEKVAKTLPEQFASAPPVRELVAFSLYRQGRFEEAQKELEGVPEVQNLNAHNVLGNLYFRRGSYARAFQHFERSLKIRPYSVETLQKSIALAWKLKLSKKGASLVHRLHKTNYGTMKSWILDSSFQIMLENFERAHRQVAFLESELGPNYPQIVGLMKSYVALRRKDQRALQDSADFECRRRDGLSCWVAMRSLGQENLGQMLEREEETLDAAFSVEALKRPVEAAPLTEPILVDQRVVEELDFKALKL